MVCPVSGASIWLFTGTCTTIASTTCTTSRYQTRCSNISTFKTRPPRIIWACAHEVRGAFSVLGFQICVTSTYPRASTLSSTKSAWGVRCEENVVATDTIGCKGSTYGDISRRVDMDRIVSCEENFNTIPNVYISERKFRHHVLDGVGGCIGPCESL